MRLPIIGEIIAKIATQIGGMRISFSLDDFLKKKE